MDKNYIQQIRDRVDSLPAGSVVAISDFHDIASANTVKQCMSRMTRSGLLERIGHGLYQTPWYSEFLKEKITAGPADIAKAIARRNNWTIAPYGDAALNYLGLSTQVPSYLIYVSDGPNRMYRFATCKIEFRHRTAREMVGMSKITIMVIEALKTLGKDRVNDRVVRKLSRVLDEEGKKKVLEEGQRAPAWIYEKIKLICCESMDGSDSNLETSTARGYSQQIRDRVASLPTGSVVAISDFYDIASANTVKQCMSRMTKSGLLERIGHGLYHTPRYSYVFKQSVCPDSRDIAFALARQNNWSIAPYGDASLNYLGLSTQVPAYLIFVTDGPYRMYKFDKCCKIEFRHRTSREMVGMSEITIMVIEALKTLGKKRVNDRVVRKLSRVLDEDGKRKVLKEGQRAPAWIYEKIKLICCE